MAKIKYKPFDCKLMTGGDVKDVALNILKVIHEFCEKHGLKYSIAYGTLLGAIRHQGFIPWDDDIDIFMLREDYDRFVEMFNADKTERYSVSTIKVDRSYQYPFAKVFDNNTIKNEEGNLDYGIAVDVFPIDKIPDNLEVIEKVLKKHSFLWRIMMLKIIQWDEERPMLKNILLVLSKPFLKLISFSYLLNIMQNSATRYKALNKDYLLGFMFPTYGKREFMDPYIFEINSTQIFEGIHFMSISRYDEYLKRIYGNYMSPPPIEDQKSHHGFKAYWKM